jgi:hypothetical protein
MVKQFVCIVIILHLESEGHIFSPIFIIYVKIHRFLKMFSLRVRVRVMVLNATFNNISVISRRSVLLEEETGVPGVFFSLSNFFNLKYYD